jgi:hypothetical protein
MLLRHGVELDLVERVEHQNPSATITQLETLEPNTTLFGVSKV